MAATTLIQRLMSGNLLVLNGDLLTTRAWAQDDGSLALVTLGPSGKPVITNAVARFHA